ncbi:MAG: hypothetical protein JSW60_02150 [Thermoplasmatales archaeon]|nr:MAG: hypothetical protein JSW60_02150 [Thermoplasmatales archaeon]
MKIKRLDNAITQILAATLLLLMALAILSTVYMYVLSYPLPNSVPYVDIVGSLDESNITLLHRGGESLDLDTELVLDIGNTTDITTVGNLLDSESKNDGFWNIGEALVYQVGDVTGLKVGAFISHMESESLIFQVWLQPTFSDTIEYYIEIGKEGNMVIIPGTLNVIIVYTDKDNDGWVQTIELEPDGGIAAILDTLEFDPNFCNNPNLIHVSGSTYAICYRAQGSDGTLKTVQIAANGSINDTIQDSLVFDSNNCFDPDIIHISGNVYAITYTQDEEDGFIKTIEILPDGDITTVQDTLEFDEIEGKFSTICHISGDIYAILYEGDDSDGFLSTVEIAANGNITDPVIDTFEFDSNIGKGPDMVHVSGDIYAIAYEGQGQQGYLKTVEIEENGFINNTVIETTMFDASKGNNPELIHVSGSIFAIVYSGNGDMGRLITVEIASDGSIVDPTVDAWEFTAYCKNPHIIRVTNNYYVISYRGIGNKGFLTTAHIANNGDIY